jgi:hypothetical protein
MRYGIHRRRLVAACCALPAAIYERCPFGAAALLPALFEYLRAKNNFLKVYFIFFTFLINKQTHFYFMVHHGFLEK